MFLVEIQVLKLNILLITSNRAGIKKLLLFNQKINTKKGCLGKRQPGNNFKKGIRESKGNYMKKNHFILNSYKRTK
jgi:hypothetical protein